MKTREACLAIRIMAIAVVTMTTANGRDPEIRIDG